MCGIAGFYGFQDKKLLKKLSSQLKHRGPDGAGFFEKKEVSLLNRRLAIIDLKTGDQPVFNEDGSVVVVYNGEIYNYKELKEKLKKNHQFKTKSDTEVIVHAYEEWGEKCFDRFNGMFALALYDKKKDKLMLVRDHFGIKPLYYSELGNGKILFSSEIKPILESGLIKKSPNERILYRYLRFRVHDDNNETFFKGINKLMPGEMMIISKNKKEKRFFSSLKDDLLNLEAVNFNNKQINNFKKELKKSVELRLISDVSVGTCLSGGLDSSTVVSLVNSLLSEKKAKSVGKVQKSFSAVFPNSINDEERYIDELINDLEKVKNYKTSPKPEEFFKDLEDFVKTQEEPTISTGPYAQYQVMKLAKDHVKVVLDGQGSDEMMAGYDPYYFVYYKQLLNQQKYFLLVKEVLFSLDILSKYLLSKIKDLLGFKKTVNIAEVLNTDFIKKNLREEFKVTNDDLKKRLIEDVFQNSLQSLLRYEDRNSMRFSIEGRVPFLDFNLIRYVFSLSDGAIIKNGWNKYILRRSTDELLPKTINRRRNKIGFTTPENEWFLRMKNRIYTIFASESFGQRKYFKQSEVLKKFQLFVEGKNDDTLLFWRLLNTEIWLRTFFDKKEKVKQEEKSLYEANTGKKLEINIDKKRYLRVPITTKLFKKNDNYKSLISNYVKNSLNEILKENKELSTKKWYVFISEKVMAIAQGRSYFLWEIKTGFWANLLSKYVKKTPYGIGLGSPWTMQLAINEAGLMRILLATLGSFLTKPFGVQGVFYKIAGREVASIDGPTEYSLYPSNVSAKLGPKEPQRLANELDDEISKTVKNDHFKGVVVIDANDLGQDVLGNSTDLKSQLAEEIFSDNPLGQGSEQTPIALVFEV